MLKKAPSLTNLTLPVLLVREHLHSSSPSPTYFFFLLGRVGVYVGVSDMFGHLTLSSYKLYGGFHFMAYIAKHVSLFAKCVFAAAALQEALKILNGEDIA